MVRDAAVAEPEGPQPPGAGVHRHRRAPKGARGCIYLRLRRGARPAPTAPRPKNSPPSGTLRWTSRHDTEAVLLPALLQRSAFRVIGRRDDGGGFGAGAVLHLCSGVVDVSNVWTTSEGLNWTEVVSAAAAVFPGRALVGYEYGADLEHRVGSRVRRPSDRSASGSVDSTSGWIP